MKRKQKRNVILSLVIPIGAFIISIISMLLSFSTYINQKKQFSYLYEDNIEFILQKKGFNHTTHYINDIYYYSTSILIDKNTNTSLSDQLFSINYTITVLNNSSLPVSIVSYQIIDRNNYHNLMYLRSSRDKLIHAIPFTIEGKSSININLELYYILSNYVNIILSRKYSFNSNPIFKDFRKEAYVNGFDLYGNKIKYENIVGIDSIVYLSPNIVFPSKVLLLNTSMHKEFQYEIPIVQ